MIDHHCNYCPYKSPYSALVLEHETEFHENAERLKCDDCDFETLSSRDLQSHRDKGTCDPLSENREAVQ